MVRLGRERLPTVRVHVLRPAQQERCGSRPAASQLAVRKPGPRVLQARDLETPARRLVALPDVLAQERVDPCGQRLRRARLPARQ
jgi:hypothetical protein